MKTLIQNVEIITMDAQNPYYPEGVILFSGDTIEYVGCLSELEANLGKLCMDEVKVVDGKGMLALPGFINAHTHIAMTAFRGLRRQSCPFRSGCLKKSGLWKTG
jgi:5-methylthioadenosine/S-adenosylhomocysteine deaminase